MHQEDSKWLRRVRNVNSKGELRKRLLGWTACFVLVYEVVTSVALYFEEVKRSSKSVV